jgi:hypothetical protein
MCQSEGNHGHEARSQLAQIGGEDDPLPFIISNRQLCARNQRTSSRLVTTQPLSMHPPKSDKLFLCVSGQMTDAIHNTVSICRHPRIQYGADPAPGSCVNNAEIAHANSLAT